MTTRNQIIERLRQYRASSALTQSGSVAMTTPTSITTNATPRAVDKVEGSTSTSAEARLSPEELQKSFVEAMTLAHGEVIQTTMERWRDDLFQHLTDNHVRNLMVAPLGRFGDLFGDSGCPVDMLAYDQKIEQLKDDLFHKVDAGFSVAFGGIAETGTLLLATGPGEPRALSLVPPISYIWVQTSAFHFSLQEAFAALEQNQAKSQDGLSLPTNLLLISGPSKTADIQQTLAYGAHGPKRLIVLLVED